MPLASVIGAGMVPVSPTFLPQATKASMAASATVMTAAVLIFDLNIKSFMNGKWISHTMERSPVDPETIYQL